MQDFFATLKEYISTENTKFQTTKPLLEMLYDVYTEFNGIEDDAIRKDFDRLYAALDGKALREIDKIIDTVCALCREHQKTGFEEGIKVGIRLAQELGVDSSKPGQQILF